MASTTIQNVSTKLALLRDGQYMNFTPGDQLKDGDVLVNNTDGPLTVSSLLNPSKENFQQVLLEPGGSTKVLDAGDRDVDLVALDGAVMQTTDEIEADAADVVLHDETSMMGLLAGGAGLGAGLLALGGLAAVAALAGSDGDNDTIVQPTGNDPTPSPDPAPVTPDPVFPPTDTVFPDPTPTPTEPPQQDATQLLGVNTDNQSLIVGDQRISSDGATDFAPADGDMILGSLNPDTATATLGGTPSETGDGNLVVLAGNSTDMNLTLLDMGIPAEGDAANNDVAVIANPDDFTLSVELGALNGGNPLASNASANPLEDLTSQLSQLGTLPGM